MNSRRNDRRRNDRRRNDREPFLFPIFPFSLFSISHFFLILFHFLQSSFSSSSIFMSRLLPLLLFVILILFSSFSLLYSTSYCFRFQLLISFFSLFLPFLFFRFLLCLLLCFCVFILILQFLYSCSGVTRDVGARGHGILTAPPKTNFLVVQKADDLFLVDNHYSPQFISLFPQLLTKLLLKPNFAPPLWTI